MKPIGNKQKGYILIGMIFMMLLVAVSAVGLNRKAGMQERMATNQTRTTQLFLGQIAAIEQALWQLTKDPCWRTSAEGEEHSYNGTTYNRTVLNADLSGYTDSVTVSITAPWGLESVSASFRYYIYPPRVGMTFPGLLQVCSDSSGNLYVADRNNHKVYKWDAITEEVTTVAGNGSSGYSGDGGLATAASLDNPSGVVVGVSGNIYIADTQNHCIRMVNSEGIISTVVGTGEEGYSGDEGLAINAKLNQPTGIFLDDSGNGYISDAGNHCIRRVDRTTLIIDTIAGNGVAGYSGDGGPAVNAELNSPNTIFKDATESLFIADTLNHCIRVVTPEGTITTVAGTGEEGYSGDGGLATDAKLNLPTGIFLDASGNAYISDRGNHCIRQVNRTTRIIKTIAGSGVAGHSGDGGAAIDAKLDTPTGLCLKDTGELVIADTMNGCIRQVDLSGIITTLFEAGLVLDNNTGIALDDSDNLFIADTLNHRVRVMDAAGAVATVAGTGTAGYSGDSGPATEAQLSKPTGLALDATGNIYIGDSNNHCIRRVDISGNIATVAGTGVSGYSGDEGPATEAELEAPRGVALDAAGNLYIADTENHCIRKVDGSGTITRVAGMGDKGGWSGDGGPATSSKLNGPSDVFVDAAGDIYIVDTLNHRIRKMDAATGGIDTIVGTGVAGYSGDGGPATDAQLNTPVSVFVDAAGNIFIADKDNHRIRVVSAHDGTINTIAGIGTAGFNGNDQPAALAQLRYPTSVAMGAARGGGKIYISDTFNNRIRMLNFQMVKELH